MAGSVSLPPLFLPLLLILLYAALPTHAFGAGNIASISKIEGANWRHGDIEDTLLQLFMASSLGGKKFDSMTVKRIYFGNWLRDYSQAIDVGSVKYVEAPTIRLILWILSFMTFGYGTGAFEVTEERLGCYRPEEHIDNPKDYADNLDARGFDRRLRGPVDEEIELAIDPQTGMKNYIANEYIHQLRNGEPMHTSAGLVRNLFGRSIDLGRSYARSGNKAELYEALRLMGTGLHCLEDFSAHSNYTELALIEMGETMVFPHVGSSTGVNIRGRHIFPLVTGTFGGVDFLHSVLGEFTDKATQSEIEQLEGAIDQATQTNQSSGAHSIIRDLLNKFHIGGAAELDSQATELEKKSKAKASQANEGQAWGIGATGEEIRVQIYPFLEWHDKIMLAINEALESIPGLMAIVEKLSEAVSIFVFSLIAPFIMPIIQQVKVELSTGSSEVIGSSKNLQFIVFTDDYSSNPTHSMLSKDHFTNCLNEPAGKVASEVIKIVVPMLMAAWDNPHTDVGHTLNEVVGLFHHPAFADGSDGRGGVQGRQRMFDVVRQWWQEKDESEKGFLRRALSREGVQEGRNHKEGQHDTGHGCGKPIHRVKPKKNGGEFGAAGDMGKVMGSALEQAFTSGGQGSGSSSGFGGLLGGIAGAAFSGYVANQMGGGESVSSGFEEVRERGFGLERGIERSYQQSSDGPRRYEERSYERPTHHGDTAAYLRSDSYGTSEGHSYYDGVERAESYSASGYGKNESHGAPGYGRIDSFSSAPGDFEERESYGEEGYRQSGYGRKSYGQKSYEQGDHGGSGASYGDGEYSYETNTSGYGREVREVSYTSQVSQVSHESTSHGGHSSYEARVEHHGHGHSHGHGHGHGHGGIVEEGYARREKVYWEDPDDERGSGYYTENRYKEHNSGEEELEYRRYRRSGSEDEVEIEYRRRSDDEEEEDEHERKKREKKERRRLEREYRRRGSGSGEDGEYYSGDERARYGYD